MHESNFYFMVACWPVTRSLFW